MKTHFFKTLLPTLLLVSALFVIGSSCNLFEPSDDDNNSIEEVCDYQGFTYTDSGTDTMIDIPETDVATEYFPNDSNGPFGMAGVEISSFTGTDTFIFVSNVITLNEIGSGRLTINNGTEVMVGVTCLKTGNAVGDELFYRITGTNIDAELCVMIDDIRL